MAKSNKEKHVIFSELKEGELLRETNDLKMAASLITYGIPLVSTRQILNNRNNRTEILFGFKHSEEERQIELAYLSRNLFIDASTLLDTRDKLINYASNGSRASLDTIVSTLNK